MKHHYYFCKNCDINNTRHSEDVSPKNRKTVRAFAYAQDDSQVLLRHVELEQQSVETPTFGFYNNENTIRHAGLEPQAVGVETPTYVFYNDENTIRHAGLEPASINDSQMNGSRVKHGMTGVFHHTGQSRKFVARIIRDLAGVTSGSTGRDGFASAHTAPYRKFGFTLAEVLITLGIIGVVAALTLPSMIHNFQKKALESQYKKSISVVTQILVSTKRNLGVNNLGEYCSYFTGGSSYPNQNECYTALYKNIHLLSKKMSSNATPYTFNIERRTDNLKTYNSKQNVTYPALAAIGDPIYQTNIMPDGSFINFRISEHKFYAGIDINGKKGPNKLGHDIFVFQVNKNGFLSSASKPIYLTDEELDNANYKEIYMRERAGNPCGLESNQKANGIGCSYYVLRDECPYDSSKRYFECLP